MDELKCKLANYHNIWRPHVIDRYYGQRVFPCSTDNYISNKASLSEHLFSFILEFMWRSPSFEPTTDLYIIPVNNASMQELVLQEHKQKLLKTCSCCKRDICHVESKHILQPPKYLIIIVNRFSDMNNKIMKNRNSIPLDLNFILGPYKFSLRSTVDHHGHSVNSGHYTASINCCGKIFRTKNISVVIVFAKRLRVSQSTRNRDS